MDSKTGEALEYILGVLAMCLFVLGEMGAGILCIILIFVIDLAWEYP